VLYTLSIDYGTTYSVGVVASEAGTEVLELSRSRYLPSLVLIDPEGELLVGGSAVNQAGLYPDRVCATPKREVGKPAILLGGEAVKVHRAIAAVLERLGEEAARRFGGAPPQRLVLTHPALWAEERLGVLREAARAARLGEPELVPEPVAAAAHYADGSLAEGATVAVYDLGGGTFDAAVLRRLAGGGFEVAGRPGGDPNLGGEDFDNELRELVEEHAARIDPESFEAAREADGAHRQWSAFRREVRQAKEALSEELKYPLAVPGVDDPVLVTRRELEALLEPHLRRTIEQLAATISDAGLAPNDLAAIYLTGGSSSIPMVSTLISQELGLTPQTWGDPKAVVALGAIAATQPRAEPAAQAPGADGEAAPTVVRCPSCGTQNRVPPDDRRRVRCARCKAPLASACAADSGRAPIETEQPAKVGTEPPGFSADPLFVDAKTRISNIVCDTSRENAIDRVAYLLDAMPVEIANGDVEFRHRDSPRPNLRLDMQAPTHVWLQDARSKYPAVREIRACVLGASDVIESVRNKWGTHFGPGESYVMVFGIDAANEAFERFVGSFCAALLVDWGAIDQAVSEPSAVPEPHQPGPQIDNDEVELFKQMHWLRITNKRFLLRGILGNVRVDVPIDDVASFKGSGLDGVRIVLTDGRTEKFSPGMLYKERALRALEQATGRTRN
jgi:actin-like ATPase involved in cell morphogenesis